MTNNTESPKEKKSPDTAIVAAIITGVVTIAVTAITVFANRPASPQATQTPITVVVTPTQAPVIPTDTVPPGASTSTPAPATDTPVPTFTAVPPVAIGQDWRIGCISNLWRPYPPEITAIDKGNGCWQEPLYVFTADNGSLSFLSERNNSAPAEVVGLFAPLPESGTVTFYIRLKDLNDVDILMGVYAEPDTASAGLLMTIPNGNVKKRSIVQMDNVADYNVLQRTILLDQNNGFWITFTFNNLSVSSTVNPSVFVTNPASIPSAEKWLFIGYKSFGAPYRIEGDFFDLKLK